MRWTMGLEERCEQLAGDHPLPQDHGRGNGDVKHGGASSTRGLAAVEDDVDLGTQGLEHLFGFLTGRLPGDIGGSPGDRDACDSCDLRGNRVTGKAHADLACSSGQQKRKRGLCHENQGQAAGPERFRQAKRYSRDLSDVPPENLRRGDQDQDRMIFPSFLDGEEPFDGPFIKGVHGQAVEGFGGHRDDPSGHDDLCGLADRFMLIGF